MSFLLTWVLVLVGRQSGSDQICWSPTEWWSLLSEVKVQRTHYQFLFKYKAIILIKKFTGLRITRGLPSNSSWGGVEKSREVTDEPVVWCQAPWNTQAPGLLLPLFSCPHPSCFWSSPSSLHNDCSHSRHLSWAPSMKSRSKWRLRGMCPVRLSLLKKREREKKQQQICLKISSCWFLLLSHWRGWCHQATWGARESL